MELSRSTLPAPNASRTPIALFPAPMSDLSTLVRSLLRTVGRPASGLTSRLRTGRSPSASSRAEELPVTDDASQRYEDLGPIARGGMGEVRRMRDRTLGRVLAMKLLRVEDVERPDARALFLDEARLTAGLQHPGVVPVHDCGTLPDGRPWFTMTEVRGTTLRAVIEGLHAGAGPPSPAALRRVLDGYLRACEAVAYAHREGVLHRDLKPDNLMVGELGEVHVLDWGLALAGVSASSDPPEIAGTPAYMSPEQGRGAPLGPASDVYALGAVLYEILCGAPPYSGTPDAVWAQLRHGPPVPVAERMRGEHWTDLIAICERAMAREPGERFPDAQALLEELRQVLDGARRRERAEALVADARELAARAAELRARASAMRTKGRALLARLSTFAPAEDKAEGWSLEDEARAFDVEVAVLEAAWSQKLHSALHEDPELEEAHAALSDAHVAALRAAEEARDLTAAARAEALLRAHDRGRHAALLRGDGALTLHTNPPGAEVLVYQYVERQRRLVPEPRGTLGRTPLTSVRLPRGSYLLRLRAPGRCEARYPVHIGRGEHWDGVRPGDSEPFAVPLLATLHPDERYVPAGFCVVGGDPAASEPLPRARVWIDGFVLRRHPVTQREYLAFLNALVAGGDEDGAAACCPRVSSSITGDVDVPLFTRGADGLFRPFAAAERAADHPVTSVDWLGATRMARWLALGGLPWRLPGELEREKAARGVDGRLLPWGDEPEPTWACMVGSLPGPPELAGVDAFPTDESPYGVRGLSGNCRDWCLEAWSPEGPPTHEGIARLVTPSLDDPALRAIRGGAWMAAPTLCRSAGRYAAAPDAHFAGVGLRLARSI